MCGIVGYIGHRQAASILLEGLTRLEYRGYDSSGVAIYDPNGLKVYRTVGKISELRKLLSEASPPGTFGLGHTRWATHGRPSENNAHPHLVKGIAVVHNGIIENYAELKSWLISQGHTFSSETDTEVISHLVYHELSQTGFDSDLLSAVRRALSRLEGTYAVAVISRYHPDYFVVAKNFSPLIIGLGHGENFVASDIPALLPFTNTIIPLKENEIARIYRDRLELFDLKSGSALSASPTTVSLSLQAAEKAGHKHFMHKEIFETPRIFTDTFLGRLKRTQPYVCFEELKPLEKDVPSIRRLLIIACGTSFHAGLVGRHYFEGLAGVPVEVDLASEFRYRQAILFPDDLAIFISQSGETADTLAALKEVKSRGVRTLAICNVMESSIARLADFVVYTRAGLEIGVASTKAFTAQVEVLLLLALYFGNLRNRLSPEELNRFVDRILRMPAILEKQLEEERKVRELAGRFVHYRDFIYMGRGINYPMALEGALKLKEISYIHAEGYAAGEMKHGPIALIDENVPVLALANRGSQLKKIISNLLEAKSRGGIIIGVVSRGDAETSCLLDYVLEVEDVEEYFQPFVNVIPLQLIAYHIADLKGTDVDQPRNLAKSVTVE